MTLTLTLTLNAQTLLGKEDIVVSDQLNHASIIDAVKVAGVQNKFRYNHSDMGDLEKQLIAASELQHKQGPSASSWQCPRSAPAPPEGAPGCSG